MCPATAVEKDGAIVIWVVTTRTTMITNCVMVKETAVKTVVEAGVSRKVTYEVARPVYEQVPREVKISLPLIVDGKTVQVTSKNGTAVDPRALPKLLKNERQVLFVRNGEIDPALLRTLDEGTLIIRVVSGPP